MHSEFTAEQRLQKQAQEARKKREEQRLLEEQNQGREEVFQATYSRYNADSGLYTVIKLDGARTYVQGPLPRGAGTGDLVMVCKPPGSYGYFIG